MQTVRQLAVRANNRRGLTTPLVAAALLVAMAGLALILDRLWLQAAQVELTTASEAAALAAARTLAGDDRLRGDVDQALLVNRALAAAAGLAARNTVAGTPVTLDLSTDDVQFGRFVTTEETGERQFLQTDAEPTHVLVTAHRSRSRGNPVALFIGELTRQSWGDVVGQAEAGLDNRLVGVRPFAGAPVPALPLAIWQVDPSGQRTDTWQAAIEQREGKDEYGYDAASQQVTTEADGIPELTLRSQPRTGTSNRVNLQVLDLGTGFDEESLRRQFTTGWIAGDLETWNGELRLSASQNGEQSSGLELPSTPVMQSAERDALESLLGEPRICLLYSQLVAPAQSQQTRTTCVEFVAIRVLAVRDLSDGGAELVVQPTVMTTRTALTDQVAEGNSYIHRLTLTK
jgi:hypothetical protein